MQPNDDTRRQIQEDDPRRRLYSYIHLFPSPHLGSLLPSEKNVIRTEPICPKEMTLFRHNVDYYYLLHCVTSAVYCGSWRHIDQNLIGQFSGSIRRGEFMGVRSSWFLLLLYFLIRYDFNGYSWNLQNRPPLFQETTRHFCRIFRRFISPKIILKPEKTRFKNVLNSMKRDLETFIRENSTKNSFIKRFYREKSQEFFAKFSALLPPSSPKVDF